MKRKPSTADEIALDIWQRYAADLSRPSDRIGLRVVIRPEPKPGVSAIACNWHVTEYPAEADREALERAIKAVQAERNLIQPFLGSSARSEKLASGK